MKNIFEIRNSWDYKKNELQLFAGLIVFFSLLILFS